MSKVINALINEYAEALEAKTIETRRYLHQHPELSTCEKETHDYIVKRLKEIGVEEVYEHLSKGTGVLGVIKGAKDGPTVALRADIDALPMPEETGLPFASTVTAPFGDKGVVPVMHACGHDAHTAMLLSAAEIIVKLKSELKGTVLLIFQPAEEGFPSYWKGDFGMAAFVKDEAFKKFKVDAAFCLHIGPQHICGAPGTITYQKGETGYSMYVFRVVIKGKGGHGNKPWLSIDPIVMGAEVIMRLQSLVSRRINFFENNASISIGAFNGGKLYNVIPDEVVLDGALRYTDVKEGGHFKKMFEDVVYSTVESVGGKAEITYAEYPIMINDAALIDKMTPRLQEILTEKFIKEVSIGVPGLDDFSVLQRIAPGIFGRLSVAPDDPDEPDTKQHSSKFLLNEKGLLNGVKALVGFAMKYAD